MEEVHSLDIPVALHLGECKEETEAQQMKELELIKPRRIGHGVFLTDKVNLQCYTSPYVAKYSLISLRVYVCDVIGERVCV